MPFRFRKRINLFPGLSLNLSAKGLSSVSFGGAPFTVNVPVARDGDTRATASLPGTGIYYTEELGGSDASDDLPDHDIHQGSRGGQWRWRRSKKGNLYKDYL